jgi:hypothetical protein
MGIPSSSSFAHRLCATATALTVVIGGVTVGTVVAAPGAQAATATFTNLLNSSGADPYMTYYNGNYYQMTTPYSGSLTMRKAPTVEALKAASPVPVFCAHAAGRDGYIWAPEMHLLDGPNGKRWYIYFSHSTDGLNWIDLNGGGMTLRSTVGTRGVRDPALVRSPGGDKYWIIATDLCISCGQSWGDAQSNGSRNLVVWESTDLVTWSTPLALPAARGRAGQTGVR